jgi:hypothetical protein
MTATFFVVKDNGQIGNRHQLVWDIFVVKKTTGIQNM